MAGQAVAFWGVVDGRMKQNFQAISTTEDNNN